MLSKNDLEKIGDLIKPLNGQFDEFAKRQELFEKGLNTNTASIIKLEQKIGATLEVNQNVTNLRDQVNNHEERISTLETQ